MEDVLDDHVPHELDGNLNKNQIDYDNFQPRRVRVGALRAQNVQKLPQNSLRGNVAMWQCCNDAPPPRVTTQDVREKTNKNTGTGVEHWLGSRVRDVVPAKVRKDFCGDHRMLVEQANRRRTASNGVWAVSATTLGGGTFRAFVRQHFDHACACRSAKHTLTLAKPGIIDSKVQERAHIQQAYTTILSLTLPKSTQISLGPVRSNRQKTTLPSQAKPKQEEGLKRAPHFCVVKRNQSSNKRWSKKNKHKK